VITHESRAASPVNGMTGPRCCADGAAKTTTSNRITDITRASLIALTPYYQPVSMAPSLTLISNP
jgi:hypothetical protein